MPYSRKEALAAADSLRRAIPLSPDAGLITVSTAPGQGGRLVAGILHAVPYFALEGRFHLYEGHTPQAVAFPVRVLHELGVRTLILTNAAGGLNPALMPGDIMILSDQINLTGQNPLVGPHESAWGARFPDMGRAFHPGLSRTAAQAATESGIRIRKGVYAGLPGPSLETPAEVKFLRTIGADAVGFSTVLETLAAVQGGMAVLGLSLITNVHDPDYPKPLTADQVIAAAEASAPELACLIAKIIACVDFHGIH